MLDRVVHEPHGGFNRDPWPYRHPSLGQAVNVELNRELPGSAFLIAGMGLVIIVLLQRSLRRWSDVAIVGLGLGSALLWMQGMIGHLDWATSAIGWNLIERSQFSNLLPILVLALGIDDSLHALHRYREERASGASAPEASRTTLSHVNRHLLTSVTTMSAFAANLMSDIPALRASVWRRRSVSSLGSSSRDCGCLCSDNHSTSGSRQRKVKSNRSSCEHPAERIRRTPPKIEREVRRIDGDRIVALLLTIPAAWGWPS